MSDGSMFARTLDTLAADPQGDMFLIGVPVAGEGYDVPGMAADTARFMHRTAKPVAVSAPQAAVRDAFRAAGVPVFSHETDALAALDQLRRHALLVQRAAGRGDEPRVEPLELPAGRERTLSEAASLELVARAGLPVAPYRVCGSSREAVDAWRELGPDVVVKACSAAIPHKSEHGLVFLHCRGAEDVVAAYEQCVAKVCALQQPLDGVIVARRVHGQREFALGVRQDCLFGTVVMVSDGGKYVEALRDFAALLFPFTEQDVLDRLAELRIAPLLAGVRGDPPVELAALARAAVDLGRFAAAHRDAIASIDVNPWIAGARGEGGWDVDAVVERAKGENDE
jgi:acetate---CoA ligase (ADP-forming)